MATGLLDNYNLRYNLGTAQLEMNTGGETWVGVPANLGDIGLADGKLLVGNGSGIATAVSLSGDATIINTGALTLATVNSNVGSFTSANITVDAKGRITAAANGAGGSSTNRAQTLNNTVDFFTTTSATNVDTGFGVTITPSSNTIGIQLNCTMIDNHTGTGQTYYTILRGIGGTDLSGAGTFLAGSNHTASMDSTDSFSIIDVPGTTSPVTYEVYVRTRAGTFRMNDGGGTCVISAIEIH